MEKLFLILLVTLCACVLLADGTELTGDPQEVSNLDHLLWISTNSSSWADYFIQTADIDASAKIYQYSKKINIRKHLKHQKKEDI